MCTIMLRTALLALALVLVDAGAAGTAPVRFSLADTCSPRWGHGSADSALLPSSLRLRGGAAALSKQLKQQFQELSKQPETFSAEQPGEHAGREDKHVPTITVTDTGLTVTVNHVV